MSRRSATDWMTFGNVINIVIINKIPCDTYWKTSKWESNCEDSGVQWWSLHWLLMDWCSLGWPSMVFVNRLLDGLHEQTIPWVDWVELNFNIFYDKRINQPQLLSINGIVSNIPHCAHWNDVGHATLAFVLVTALIKGPSQFCFINPPECHSIRWLIAHQNSSFWCNRFKTSSTGRISTVLRETAIIILRFSLTAGGVGVASQKRLRCVFSQLEKIII